MKNDNYGIGIKYELPGKPLMCILTLGFPNADLALSKTFFPYKHAKLKLAHRLKIVKFCYIRIRVI